MKTFVSLALISILPLAASAQTAPKLLPFQGRVTDAQGAQIPDGPRVIRFRISESPTENRFIWPGELHRTSVNGGLVNVVLGSKTRMQGFDFGGQLFLEVTVDANGDQMITAADPPMLPRQGMLPLAFAWEAADSRKLGGYDWSSLFGSNDPRLPIPGERLRDGSVTSAQLGLGSIEGSRIAPGAITVELLARAVIDQLVPAGSISAYGGTLDSTPDGWILCDGSALRSADPRFKRLFERLRTSWGDGSAAGPFARFPAVTTGAEVTDFNVPDLRGRFLRGVSGLSNLDPDAAERVRSLPGGNPGNEVGSIQGDQFRSHDHPYNDYRPHGQDGVEVDTYLSGSNDSVFRLDGRRQTLDAGGNETRPKNANVYYIIKY